jgi:hypothetical protein
LNDCGALWAGVGFQNTLLVNAAVASTRRLGPPASTLFETTEDFVGILTNAICRTLESH